MNDYTIIIDSREKEHAHILQALKTHNISFKIQKLDVGDYAISVNGDIHPVVIERKADVNEIIGNLLDKRRDEFGKTRFIRELDRAKESGIKVILLIEDKDWYLRLLTGQYISMVKPKSITGMLISLQAKYSNLSIVGLEKEIVPSYIHKILYYHARENLK